MPLDPRKPIGPLFFSTDHTTEEKAINKHSLNNLVHTNQLNNTITNKTARKTINNVARKITRTPVIRTKREITIGVLDNNLTHSPRFISDIGPTPVEIGAYIYSFLSLIELTNLMLISKSFRLFILQLEISSQSTKNHRRYIVAELEDRKISYEILQKNIKLSYPNLTIKNILFNYVEEDNYHLLGIYLERELKSKKYSGYVPGFINLKLFYEIVYPLLSRAISAKKINCFNEAVRIILQSHLRNYFFNSHFEPDQFLIKNLTGNFINPLTYVIKQNFLEFVQPILDLPTNVIIIDAINDTIKQNDLNLLEQIISHKTNTQEPTIVAATRIACELNNIQIISYLLSNNHLVNIAKSDGTTALHVAIACKHLEVARTLLDAGANCTANSTMFGTIEKMAKKCQHRQISRLIKTKIKEQRKTFKQEESGLAKNPSQQPSSNTTQNENNLTISILAKTLTATLNQNSNDNDALESSASSYNSTID